MAGKVRILIIVLVMTMLLPGDIAAQVASSLDDVVRAQRLTRGEAVYVTVVGGQRLKAEISEVSSTALRLRDGQRQWDVDARDLLKVERRDSISGGIWVGLGLSFVTTPVACAAIGPSCVWAPALLGALVGGVVDASLREVLYEAPAHDARRVNVSPTVAKNGAGVRLSVRW